MLRRIRWRVVPSPAHLRPADPRARRGRSGLLIAYLARLGQAVGDTPTALRDLARARRAGATVGPAPDRPRPSRRLTWSRIRVAGWTAYAVVSVHGQLRRRPLAQVRVPRCPVARPTEGGAMLWVLRLGRVRCLPSALVRQQWHGQLNRSREVVVGVRQDSAGRFRAHAWLVGDRAAGFHALHTHPWPG